jgi:hypothetical protein
MPKSAGKRKHTERGVIKKEMLVGCRVEMPKRLVEVAAGVEVGAQLQTVT